MDVDKMEAGRELDFKVGIWVMGWKFDEHESGDVDDLIPHYSTDIAAAWQVVEVLQKRGWDMCLEYHAGLWTYTLLPELDASTRDEIEAWGDTAPLAICRAALRVN